MAIRQAVCGSNIIWRRRRGSKIGVSLASQWQAGWRNHGGRIIISGRRKIGVAAWPANDIAKRENGGYQAMKPAASIWLSGWRRRQPGENDSSFEEAKAERQPGVISVAAKVT